MPKRDKTLLDYAAIARVAGRGVLGTDELEKIVFALVALVDGLDDVLPYDRANYAAQAFGLPIEGNAFVTNLAAGDSTAANLQKMTTDAIGEIDRITGIARSAVRQKNLSAGSALAEIARAGRELQGLAHTLERDLETMEKRDNTPDDAAHNPLHPDHDLWFEEQNPFSLDN